MEKAYDLKELGKRLKAKGLIELEDAAEEIYKELKGWLKESAALSATPYDDIAVPFLDNLDKFVIPQIDKIDGQPG
jgi:hypothetical protein